MKHIMIDLDEVVADWFGHASIILGKQVGRNVERVAQEEWDILKTHQRLFRDLPIKEGATELVEWCLNFKARTPNIDVKFLTAIPGSGDMPWAAYDKVMWCLKNFPEVPMFIGPYSGDKWKHCKPGDILIDDRYSNFEEWNKAGGHAHLYRNWPDCKVWLEEHFGL